MNLRTPYEDLLLDVLENGTTSADRTGTGTIKVFGRQIRFNLSQGFPLITTKKVHTRAVFAELLWFLSGDTNEHTLRDLGVKIWAEWAPEDGELGPVYGHQWRSFGVDVGQVGGVDQIASVVQEIKDNPFSRRLLVSAWDPARIQDMALPACHTMFQFNVRPGKDGIPHKLDLQLYQRSADLFLGVPFNIASYAALVHLVAAQTGLVPGDFVHSFGDAHIYLNHQDEVREQLSRSARPFPRLVVSPRASIFDHTLSDFELVGYDPHPRISAPVSV